MKEIIHKSLQEASDIYAALLADSHLIGLTQELALDMIKTLQNGNRVFLCGNGGSAADAQHFAAELTGCLPEGKAPRSVTALCADTAVLTAIANDSSFSDIYACQLRSHARPGDLLICLSTSGNSENLLHSARMARELGLETAALLGSGGGKLGALVDLPLIVPCVSTPRIQECHILLIHILCMLVEKYG